MNIEKQQRARGSQKVYWRKRYWRRRLTGKGAYRMARPMTGRKRRVSGRGSYTMNPNDSFGRRYGGYLGSKAGEFLGGWAQRAVGLGAYSVKKNVLDGRLPEMTNISGNGGTVVRYQEYLGDVVTSAVAGAYKNDAYLLNAANENTFPWLSQIAGNYDQYEIQGILFEFRSTSGNALTSTNTALGTVMMATQYDTVDTPFASKVEMLNYEYSTSGLPSESHIHMVECDPHQTPLPLMYTEPGSTNPANTDPRLYFLGRFQIATQGFQGTSVNIGELHCTYQVKLLKPKLVTTLGLTNGFYKGVNSVGVTAAQPLGTINNIVASYSNSDFDFTETDIQLPTFGSDKQYLIEVIWNGTVSTTPAFPTISFGNGASDGGGAFTVPNGIAGITRMSLSQQVNVAGSQLRPYMRLAASTGTIPTGTATVTVIVNEIPVPV